jgi:catechol 2,3-dioxygenase-like lactoylglutathione lyase family enzyme
VNLFQVNLFVLDFPLMLRFYRDILGFEVHDIDPGPSCVPLVDWVSLGTGDVIIELFHAERHWDPALLTATNRDAVQLCFIVDDAERERARLAAVGVELDPLVTEQWGRYASFCDPEGNRLQIFEVFATP